MVIGTRLGPYEVLAKLGEGGMGEVYRATDSHLKRSVAIKVLPASVTGDADRLARFQREAEVLAALNHPNIAAIYGLEKTPGLTAIVMELVEGDDLSRLIAHGALPLSDALPIARQIAEALEAAHEQGIVHRDLKPANIKVRADGTVKVLDFGLAKAMDPAGASSADAMNSPTLTGRATQAGVILGTAAYMAPEQARGRSVDRRADIWAFGVVLYEMLTGRRAFGGDDVSITVANVLKDDVDWQALPADVPPALRRLLKRCLDKDPKRRLRDIGEARVQIDELLSGVATESGSPARVTPAPGRTPMRVHLVWAAIVLTVAALTPLALRWLGNGPQSVAMQRFELGLPARTQLPGWPMISPDGRHFVVVALGDDQVARIWIRSSRDEAFAVLPGTEGASYPFWSPNSESIAFFSADTLKRIPIAGGPAQTVCPAARARGGTWGTAAEIVFSATADGKEQLLKVAETSGSPSVIPSGFPSAALRRFPSFLPDGRHFLFFATARDTATDGVYVGSIDGGISERIIGAFSQARYSNGSLFFVRDSVLLAQPFDPDHLTLTKTDPVVVMASPIADGENESSKAFSVAVDGTVVAVPLLQASKNQLRWFDRNGRSMGDLGPASSRTGPRISPNEQRVATRSNEGGQMTKGGILWLTDLKDGQPERITFSDDDYLAPVWASDATIVFAKVTSGLGTWNLFRQPTAPGGTQEPLVDDRAHKRPMDVSRDGQYLVYAASPTQSTVDLWMMALADRKPSVYVKNADYARISPDGHWLAYTGDESGHPEVYIEGFPKLGGKTQVSYGGGDKPVWSRTGDQLFYQANRKLMAVPVAIVSGAPRVGKSVPLFDLPVGPAVLNVDYDVTRDGRFLFNLPVSSESPRAVITLNWKSDVRK